MNADRLLALYARIADAPDAVARLRRFVLDLAVRGKLVPQDVGDEPAWALLKRKEIDVTLTGPFELPLTWMWIRVGAVSKTRLGKMLDRSKNKGDLHPYLRNINVRWFDFDLSDVLDMPFEASEIEEFSLRAGDVLICEGGEPGRAAVWDGRMKGVLFQKAIHRARFDPHIDPHFFVKALKASANDGRLAQAFTGTGIKHFTGKTLDEYSFPLPPLAEQHRIVVKVDELMSLCDQLETARAGREAVRDRLATASLARLGAPDPETFQADARFVLDALPALTARPDQIKALRQTILNLAVCGRLLPQSAKDEPISETLNIALARRAALVKAKKVRTKNIIGSSDLKEDPDLPLGWSVERLGNLVDPENTLSYGVLVPGEEVFDGIPFVRAQDLALSDHPERPNKTISPEIEKAYARTRLRGGEILVCVVGSIGKIGIVPRSWAGANIARAVVRVLPIPQISQEYLLVVLRSDPVQAYFKETTRTLAQPTLNVSLMEQTPIPLPPLAEQYRIVAKVDALMSLCDRLEASLITAANARRRLLDAVLAEALAPADDTSSAMVEPTAATAPGPLGAGVTTERSAFVVALAYERHRSARRDKTFGHTKAEKILHLVEAEAGLDLGRTPIRDAAGPNDFDHLLGIDRWAKQHRRYAFDKDGKGYTFEPLADFQASLDVADTIDAATRARVEAIIALFVPMDMRGAELFATVYAAWNNLLIEGKSPTDAEILRAAREDWHPKKLKIPPQRFVAALQHLKASKFVPSGRGKFVAPAPQRDLFPGA